MGGEKKLCKLECKIKDHIIIVHHEELGRVLFLILTFGALFLRPTMDMIQDYVKPIRDFAKDSMRLVKRCTKPDLKGKSSVWHVLLEVRVLV